VDLAVQRFLVVGVVEVAAVFPAQAVERRHRQHLDIVGDALAGQREQLLDADGSVMTVGPASNTKPWSS
jgi:hypothetical protein